MSKFSNQGSKNQGGYSAGNYSSKEKNQVNKFLFKEEWLKGENICQEAIDNANNLAEKIAGMSTSQLRKFFGPLKKLQLEIKVKKGGDFGKITPKLIMMKPMLAYSVGKKRTQELQFFYDSMEGIFSKIDSEKKFYVFFNYVEALVAFHKFHSNHD
jgi:CRISPR type III-A-associated protein Csm2